MVKDKLHTISDEDAIEVAKILLKTSQSHLYEFTYEKINRVKYDSRDGTDAEEAVNVYFKGVVKDELYRKSGWQDERISIRLIERDRYHDYPYFYGTSLREPKIAWSYKFLSNQVEAVEFLQSKNLL